MEGGDVGPPFRIGAGVVGAVGAAVVGNGEGALVGAGVGKPVGAAVGDAVGGQTPRVVEHLRSSDSSINPTTQVALKSLQHRESTTYSAFPLSYLLTTQKYHASRDPGNCGTTPPILVDIAFLV